ncbi:hypothetical protein COU80_03140 [Candidatus Peregrinibacteria bacterium CG10_big_fil_rev_8_21_14_0_10_55_24]|nr:MAG: hypothetical protein COU80_03140 [Candidatus Peregrinibacteria bacterium CG10_big_fil_rev_8_21_14_0_10_55_24]
MPQEVVRYPRSEFHAEYRRVRETGGFSGERSRSLTQLKYTLPGIRDTDRNTGIAFDLQTAIVLQETGIRNDLSAIFHQTTLKGIGSPSGNRRRHSPPIDAAVDCIFEQVGLGGTYNLFVTLMRRYRRHIDESIRHRISLTTPQGTYGNIDADTMLLHDVAHLKNNGFDTSAFEMPNHASGVLLSNIRGAMSRKQVQQLLDDTDTVNWKYDRTPRIILRTHVPDSLFDNWGNHPRMQSFVSFRSSQQDKDWSKSLEVPLPEVTRTVQRVSPDS